VTSALDELQAIWYPGAGETGRMKREGRPPVLKKSHWLLLRRSENLGANQHFRLRDLLRYNLKAVRAYLLKDGFQPLWKYSPPPWAGQFLDEWC
jgi:transposase